MAPQARLNDGKWDLLVLSGPTPPTRWKLISLFNKVFKGTHVEEGSMVDYRNFTKLEIRNDSETTAVHGPAFCIDGDNMGSLPVSIQVVAHALRVFV